MTELTRLTVNLVPKADAALTVAVNLTGDSKTDTVNRALQVYAFMMQCTADGDKVILQHANGKSSLVKFA